ncbi:hypothetical protein ACFQZV_08140 [Microbacterium koreense]|uniref:Lipoprotein n=1 Tax=Microbacterium koreense TaxID=323761 RepID=A0ABW2ZRZ5_9MICO
MRIRIPERGFAWRLRSAFLTAALVATLVGCAHVATPSLTDESPAPVAEADTWEEAWDAAFGPRGVSVGTIRGVADDFPLSLPMPDGTLVASTVGLGVWDMTFETEDAENEADELVAALDEQIDQVSQGSTPAGGEYWRYFDDTYAVQVQMEPGPTPPAMVAVVVIEHGLLR